MTPFVVVTDSDLLKAKLLNKARLTDAGCWEWVGTRRRGYGMLSHGNKTVSAHRIAYAAYHGPIPSGMVVRHTCDNPSCINPDHLCHGTQQDNVMDRDARGRRDVKGEQVGTAKLTEADVLDIRASVLPGTALAEKYSISPSTISLIKTGKSWKHVMEASRGR